MIPNANRIINIDNKTYDITVNKVSITPLGNQILLTEITKEGDDNEVHGGKGAVTKSVDRNTGRYTQTITSYNKDMRFSGITKIETCVDSEVELLYDQQIKIDLE